MLTCVMSTALEPLGRSPVKVALVSDVACSSTKSSAASRPLPTAPPGRDAIPMRPSTLPVLNTTVCCALAAEASNSATTARPFIGGHLGESETLGSSHNATGSRPGEEVPVFAPHLRPADFPTSRPPRSSALAAPLHALVPLQHHR